jgi:hypothetical protein
VIHWTPLTPLLVALTVILAMPLLYVLLFRAVVFVLKTLTRFLCWAYPQWVHRTEEETTEIKLG